MYVRLATGALLVLDAKNLHRPLGILVPLDEHWTARINSLESLRAQLLHHKRLDLHRSGSGVLLILGGDLFEGHG